MLKNVDKIVESVPKSYRGRALLLMRHLLDKAVPARINWNEHGVVTIDGDVIKDSNITELINKAMRERKTMKAEGRVQFARLFRVLNTSSVLVGNKKLLTVSSSNLAKLRLTASSTPIASRVTRSTTEQAGRGKRKRHREEKTKDCTLFSLHCFLFRSLLSRKRQSYDFHEKRE
jgi:hypothetical protein